VAEEREGGRGVVGRTRLLIVDVEALGKFVKARRLEPADEVEDIEEAEGERPCDAAAGMGGTGGSPGEEGCGRCGRRDMIVVSCRV
jgi:hypothetical protein